MRFCNRPYEHMYVTRGGVVRCCSWATKRPIGNLADQSMEEVWNGPDAQALRESIEDQSFRYCSKLSCPLLSNDSLPDLTPEQFAQEVERRRNASPVEFNIAYDFVCNHKCPSCREKIFKPSIEYKALMKNIEVKLIPYLRNARLIMASGNGDVFSSKYMLRLLSRINPADPDCLIKLETNGSLTFKNWQHIEHLEKHRLSIVVTPNSYERKTYRILAGGKDNLASTLESLYFLADLRKQQRIKEFKITMVIQPENFREVPAFVEKCLSEFDPDVIQLRPLMPWFEMTGESYTSRNLLDPNHPEHDEFVDIMNHPVCSHPKVYHWIGTKHYKR